MTKDRKCSTCPNLIYRDNKTGLCLTCFKAKVTHIPQEPAQQLEVDRAKQRTAREVSSLKFRYAEALKTIETQQKLLGVIGTLQTEPETYTIEDTAGSHQNEGTVVVVASDWHVEENVGEETTGLNHFNLDIASQRTEKFFQSTLRLTRLLQQDIRINHMVLALLGDFITNDIHDELRDLTEALPSDAILQAEGMLISGIQFLLDHSDLTFTIPCHSGNHARTTKQTHFSAESGYSLEYLMYAHMADRFRNEPRLHFIVPRAYHSFVQVYNTTMRFHHGHAVNYQGGVGGIYIPVNKAIAQWNKARHADLDVFGHFHQLRDGGNFITNGSLIGYNGFAVSIKADFEVPKQALFLLDKKRGRTCTWPIYV